MGDKIARSLAEKGHHFVEPARRRTIWEWAPEPSSKPNGWRRA